MSQNSETIKSYLSLTLMRVKLVRFKKMQSTSPSPVYVEYWGKIFWILVEKILQRFPRKKLIAVFQNFAEISYPSISGLCPKNWDLTLWALTSFPSLVVGSLASVLLRAMNFSPPTSRITIERLLMKPSSFSSVSLNWLWDTVGEAWTPIATSAFLMLMVRRPSSSSYLSIQCV